MYKIAVKFIQKLYEYLKSIVAGNTRHGFTEEGSGDTADDHYCKEGDHRTVERL